MDTDKILNENDMISPSKENIAQKEKKKKKKKFIQINKA